MRGAVEKRGIICPSAALAAARSTTPPPQSSSVTLPSGSGVYRIAERYEQEGVRYYPRRPPEYDRTAVPSWSWPDAAGAAGGRASPPPVGAAPAARAAAPPQCDSCDAASPSPENLDAKAEAPVTVVPVPAVTHLYVQVGAFSVRENAERLKNRL